jgi:hypothetical protein
MLRAMLFCRQPSSLADSWAMARRLGAAPSAVSFGDSPALLVPSVKIAATRLRSGASTLATWRHAIRPWPRQQKEQTSAAPLGAAPTGFHGGRFGDSGSPMALEIQKPRSFVASGVSKDLKWVCESLLASYMVRVGSPARCGA